VGNCAPAAILRRSGHFSGPFSGVEPLSSVTRHYHGSQIHYHRKLIRQILESHPEPKPQCQSFSRSYGSVLPTSLAYIVPLARGCSPWRPDAVMSTTGSVTRHYHGSQIHYHRKLIRQILERHVAGARPCDQLSYSESTLGPGGLGFPLINAPPCGGFGACISSRITIVIQVGSSRSSEL